MKATMRCCDQFGSILASTVCDVPINQRANPVTMPVFRSGVIAMITVHIHEWNHAIRLGWFDPVHVSCERDRLTIKPQEPHGMFISVK